MAIFGSKVDAREMNSTVPRENRGDIADARKQIGMAPERERGFARLEIKKKAFIDPFLAMNSDLQDNETKQVRLLNSVITKLLEEHDKKNVAMANTISRFIELYERCFNDPSHSDIFFEEDLKALLNEISKKEQ